MKKVELDTSRNELVSEFAFTPKNAVSSRRNACFSTALPKSAKTHGHLNAVLQVVASNNSDHNKHSRISMDFITPNSFNIFH